MPTIAEKTLGCKVNTYESQSVLSEFNSKGYDVVSFDEEADVYLINTCTVTNNGDRKSRQTIKKAIKNNPASTVIVMGCYAQLKSEEIIKIPGVDIVIGTNNRTNLVELVEKSKKEKIQIRNITNIMKEKEFESLQHEYLENKTRGFLKIQDGCNNFCTFCIIPWARGLIRSNPLPEVIKQANLMVKSGIKEIVLTGIHTGGYGEDQENLTFNDLLIALEEVEDLERYRISSIEINQLTKEVLATLKNSKKFAPHLHIPIQSGSDEILKAMRRNYNYYTFKLKIDEIRLMFPNISISTDLIVGFPGETRELFEETKKHILELEFSQLHVFPYSSRSGTPAARMKNQIDGIAKKEYVHEMLTINEQLMKQYASKFLEKEVFVLGETILEDQNVSGHSDNYLKVEIMNLKNSTNYLNKITKVKILNYEEGICKGIVE